MAARFRLPSDSLLNDNANPLAGGTLTFCESETSTPLATFSDDGLTTANSNPLTLDAAGRHGDIFLQAQDYKVIVKDASGTTIKTMDPVHGTIKNLDSLQYSAADYGASFSTGATAADDADGVLVLDKDYTLLADTTVAPATKFVGGQLTRGTNAVTFSKPVEFGPVPAFDAAGTGVVTFVRTPRLYVCDMGVTGDGTTDDANALTQAIRSANASKAVLIGNNSLACNLKSGITIPPTLRAEFNGMRVQPDATLTSGYLVTVDGTQTGYVGAVLGRISGLQIFQALTSNHADTSRDVDGMALGSATSASSLRFDDLDIQGFRDLLAIKGPNVYIEGFYNTRLYIGWRRGIAYLATSNSGENFSFHGGAISNINNTSFNGAGLYIDPAVTAAEFNFHGVSFDYCDVSVEHHVGHVSCFGCHFENNNPNSHVKLFKHSSRVPADFVMHGGYLGSGGGSTSWTGISTEPATGRASLIETSGGSQSIEVIGVKCGGFNQTDQVTEIVRQTDSSAPRRITIRPILDAGTGTNSSVPLAMSFKVNSLFLSTTDLSSWTQNGSSGTTQSFDNTTVYSPAVGSRKTVSASGNSSSLVSKLMPCKPGDNIVAKVYVNCTTFTSGGYLAIQLKFYAGDGTTQIGSQTESKQVTAATSGWVPVWVSMRVPDGAAYATLADYCNTFTGTAYFSNEHVWVY